MFYYSLVVDRTNVYFEYLRSRYEKQIVVESVSVVEKESANRVERALTEGCMLVVRNFDLSLMELILPIIEWKERRMMRMLRHFITTASDHEAKKEEEEDPFKKTLRHDFVWHDETVFTFSEQTRKEEVLAIFGKNITVHKNFRLICCTTQLDFAFSKSLFSKLSVFRFEIEDEVAWKQTVFDHMLNTLHSADKIALIDAKINAIVRDKELLAKVERDNSFHRINLPFLYQSLSTIQLGLSHCSSCEDAEFLHILHENSERIRQALGIKEAPSINSKQSASRVDLFDLSLACYLDGGDTKNAKTRASLIIRNAFDSLSDEEEADDKSNNIVEQDKDRKIEDLLSRELQ